MSERPAEKSTNSKANNRVNFAPIEGLVGLGLAVLAKMPLVRVVGVLMIIDALANHKKA
jgi:hypothetical protein